MSWARRWNDETLAGLRALRAVLGAALLAALDSERVERAANDVVADAREVVDAAAAHEHDRVLLQVVAFARNVGGDRTAVREPDAGDLAERRVRLLGRHGLDLEADAALLRALIEVTGLAAALLDDAGIPDELVDRRHLSLSLGKRKSIRTRNVL